MAKRHAPGLRAIPSSKVALLVVERGDAALRLSELMAECGGSLDTVVVAQQPDEGPGDLAARVIHRLRKLEREGCALVSSTLLTNSDFGTEWQSARSAIVRVALQLISVRGDARAVGRPGEPVSETPAVSETLSGLLGAHATTIRVGGPRRSGRKQGGGELSYPQVVREACA